MSNEGDRTKHPAAQHSDQLAWAVWIRDDRNDECISVVADSAAEAKEKAIEASDIDDYHSLNVDGPFQDAEPAYFEFEYTYEARETVVVEAPTESYAKESADHERTLPSGYVQTLHTDSRRIPKGDSDE